MMTAAARKLSTPMSDLAILRQYLRRVENDIVDTKARIATLHREAQRARFTGRDPSALLQQLESWKSILLSMQQHRDNLTVEIEGKANTEPPQDQATLVALETWRK